MRPRRGSAGAPAASFDSVVLAAVVAECQELVGARVQRVAQAGPHGLILTLRRSGRTRALLVSAHPQWCRMHLTEETGGGAAVPFAQLARSRLEGATLRAVAAPPFERVATCTFEALEGPRGLVAELTGRTANLVLLDGDAVAGSLRALGGDREGHAPAPRSYLPPPQPRPTPATVTDDALLAAADPDGTGDRPAWRAVLAAVAGLGPAMCWEVCLRAGLDPTRPLAPNAGAPVIEALGAVAATVREERFTPVLYRDAEDRPAAYAPFPLRCFEALRGEAVAMSAAVEAVMGRAAEAAGLEAARRTLAAAVGRAAGRTRRALEAVDADLREAAAADGLRASGELILAYLSQIPAGASVAEVPGFDGAPVRIPLDPSRSGVENAQAYFKRYAKAAAARRRLPARRTALEAERTFLETAANAVAQAEGADDLWEVEEDLVAAGLFRRRRPAVAPRAAAAERVFEIADGVRARVGRSARENERLTFRVAGPDDLWLHARGMPGAHVIVTGAGADPGEAVLLRAARLAAYYSAGRDATRVPVDVTRRRHVRRIRGGRPGQVQYSHERTLLVAPGLPERPV